MIPMTDGRTNLRPYRLARPLCLVLLAACAPPGGGAAAVDPDEREWVQLFNGRDLDGWTVKFRGQPLGADPHRTFRVEDGLLKVRYDGWNGFDGEFGHLFYKDQFSYYIIGAEYRFVGGQVTGAPSSLSWALRNNGLMLHSQSASSMGLDQDFPISLEMQLLGGLGQGPRTTGNLCTPGTHVVMGDTLVEEHCIPSSSATYEGDRWVRVEALVLGDSVIKHIVEGDTVLVYRKPVIGGGVVAGFDPAVKRDGTPLREGHIALQAETAEIDFRKVEILDLEGCTDPDALNYKRYHMKADPGACEYAGR